MNRKTPAQPLYLILAIPLGSTEATGPSIHQTALNKRRTFRLYMVQTILLLLSLSVNIDEIFLHNANPR